MQINTGGNCHLDAPMIRAALPQLPLAEIDLLFIENVGNLVCPAEFELGADLAVVVASVPEGHDKPYKYPGMFAAADAVLLNKADVLAVLRLRPGLLPPRAGDGQPGCAAVRGLVPDGRRAWRSG